MKLGGKNCDSFYCDANVGCPKGCGGCDANRCSSASSKSNNTQYRRMSGDYLEGYTSIFKEKNYWIGVAAGVIGLLAYQKYFKK